MMLRPTSLRGTLLLALGLAWLGSAPRARGQEVRVGNATHKYRPSDSLPTATSANIEAARNEFEAFQIVISGGASGVSGVTASVSDLTGPGGAILSSDHIVLYRVGLYNVSIPSNTEGSVGPWPDPLIPAVDPYYHETRNAFPFDVPPGELRAIWVDIFVPSGTPAGVYQGTVTVQGSGLGTKQVPISLRVRNFELPSTASLPSAYFIGTGYACRAHLGSCSAAQREEFQALYAKALLDHRMTPADAITIFDAPSFSTMDQYWRPLLLGTADTWLQGARLTTIQVRTRDSGALTALRQHLESMGWGGILFDYTCDEPPAGCSFSSIPGLASGPQAAGVRTMVTTDIDSATAHGLLDAIDILCPLINVMHNKGQSSRRGDYDSFLARSSMKLLWWYQSCVSHGCASGCATTTDPYYTGWPSYMIDCSAIQNRAMEWLTFTHDIQGELYFGLTHMLSTAWTNSCDFGGNGDGTLLYPGRPSDIGGTHHIPVMSIRIKMIREGMEDYEYLTLLKNLGDEAYARQVASGLFPEPGSVTSANEDQLYQARSLLADRIEQLLGGSGPVANAGPDQVLVDRDGDGVETAHLDGSGSLGNIVSYEWLENGQSLATGVQVDVTFAVGTHTVVLRVTDNQGATAEDQVVITVQPQPQSDYTIVRAEGPVTLDGDLSEFGNAQVLVVTVPDTGAQAHVRLLWDDEALYVGAEVSDTKLEAIHSGKDERLWQDDSVEMMFDPNADGGSAIGPDDVKGFVNVLGAIRDSIALDAGRDIGLEATVSVSGTVNDSADTDQGYVVEARIPWSGMGIGTPSPGDQWRMDFVLNDRHDETQSWGSWSHGTDLATNVPDNWNTAVFLGESQTCEEGATRPCGTDEGECEKGTQTCVNGQWTWCSGGRPPTDEFCDDGKDNDCDGQTDEPDCTNLPDRDGGSGGDATHQADGAIWPSDGGSSPEHSASSGCDCKTSGGTDTALFGLLALAVAISWRRRKKDHE